MEKLNNPRFFTRRILLDDIFNRKVSAGNHWVYSPHASVKVVGTNDDNFILSYVPDPYSDDTGSTVLKKNIPKNFKTQAGNGCFENATAQAGVWVDVEFTIEDEALGGGSEIDISGAVQVAEGSTHSSAVVVVPHATAITIFAANSLRIKGTLQNKGPNSIWVGNNTAAELTHADYKIICEEILPGGSFEWRNTGSIFARAEISACNVSVRTEV